ncbi:MAG TPA: DUF1015 domain-containing protein [Actinomycetota bacterium]|nr:DUF1015 domain-containing protein [Actinomycetota bacterium]
MPNVAPFDGLLFDPARVGDLAAVTAPPYDIIGREEQHRLHRSSPYNIALVDLGRDRGGSRDKYTRAGDLFRRWRDEGALSRAGRPAFYPYEMRFVHQGSPRTVRGVVMEVGLEPWGGGVLPHERTMAAPVEDRLALMRATRANISPIYALCAGPSESQAALLEHTSRRQPDREVADEAGVVHRLWIEDPAEDVSAWHRDRALLVADGHHRYQTALAFQEEARGEHGPGPWDAVMMLVVDSVAEDPPVLPIHRVARLEQIPRLPGHRVRDLAEVLVWLAEGGLRFGAAVRRRDGLEHLVGTLEGDPPAVTALHREILDTLDGIREIGYLSDAAAAEEAVRSGASDLALFLPAARVEEIRSVIDGGGRLPQKSTYFWPKPRTGMVIRPLD